MIYMKILKKKGGEEETKSMAHAPVVTTARGETRRSSDCQFF
jgi:hypothetical protein